MLIEIPKGYRFTHGVRRLKPVPKKKNEPWDWQGEILETSDDLEALYEKYKDRMSSQRDIVFTQELVEEKTNPSLTNEQIAERKRKKLLKKLQMERLTVVENLKKYGGAFERSLANCIGWADNDNTIKIYNTWTEIWNNNKEKKG